MLDKQIRSCIALYIGEVLNCKLVQRSRLESGMELRCGASIIYLETHQKLTFVGPVTLWIPPQLGLFTETNIAPVLWNLVRCPVQLGRSTKFRPTVEARELHTMGRQDITDLIRKRSPGETLSVGSLKQHGSFELDWNAQQQPYSSKSLWHSLTAPMPGDVPSKICCGDEFMLSPEEMREQSLAQSRQCCVLLP
jgi:hypothetical protein